VPVHFLSQTGESINLHSRCSLAKLLEVKMVIDMSKENDLAKDFFQLQ